MTFKPNIEQSFPLLPYSQLVWDMMKYEPKIYNNQILLKVSKKQVETENLENAFRKAFLNHPAFSTIIDENGLQTFCDTNDILHGQFHSIDFTDEGDSLKIAVSINRILGDGASGRILIEDFIKAYLGEQLEKDNYANYLAQLEKYKLTERYQLHKQWLEQHFAGDYPVHPRTDLPLSEKVESYEALYFDDYTAQRTALAELGDKYVVSLSAIVSLAACLAIMDYNGMDTVAITWAYEGREKHEEQRVFGSLHRDIPLLIKKENSKAGLLRQIRQELRDGISHSTYPYTLTPPYSDKWNYAVNVLQMDSVESMLAIMPFPFEVLDTEEPRLAYSLLDIEIYDEQQLTIVYRYSSAHYKEESIRRFASLVRLHIEQLCRE
ncbi:MAG: hypothetical protein IJS73_00200 [Paludibacteraceae bacterium]|nr:hypothetical protein [Paludibacteraceae bacterium]